MLEYGVPEKKMSAMDGILSFIVGLPNLLSHPCCKEYSNNRMKSLPRWICSFLLLVLAGCGEKHPNNAAPNKKTAHQITGTANWGEFIPNPIPPNSELAQSLTAADGKTYLLQYTPRFTFDDAMRIPAAKGIDAFELKNGKRYIAYGDKIQTLAESGISTSIKNDTRLVLFTSHIESAPESTSATPLSLKLKEDLSETEAWQRATESGTLKSIGEYLKLFPNGKFQKEAIDKQDALRADGSLFTNATDMDYDSLSAESKQQTINFPNPPELRIYKREITKQNGFVVRTISETLSRGDEVVSSKRFQTQVPEGNGLDSADLEKARMASALAWFIEQYPGHKNVADALRMQEGLGTAQPIVELIAANKITAHANGHGIDKMELVIKNNTAEMLCVVVPAGAYFESSKADVQSMSATAGALVFIGGNIQRSSQIAVTCANRSKKVPVPGDTFSIKETAQSDELSKLMRVLSIKRPGNTPQAVHSTLPADAWSQGDPGTVIDFAIRQAATWIVSDDATFEELGILVNKPSYIRQINEVRTVIAMKILADAGIDVEKKKIWKSRDRLLQMLSAHSPASGTLARTAYDWLKAKQ